MKKVKEVKVIREPNTNLLEQKINELIKQGYQPTETYAVDSEGTNYSTLMVLYSGT